VLASVLPHQRQSSNLKTHRSTPADSPCTRSLLSRSAVLPTPLQTELKAAHSCVAPAHNTATHSDSRCTPRAQTNKKNTQTYTHSTVMCSSAACHQQADNTAAGQHKHAHARMHAHTTQCICSRWVGRALGHPQHARHAAQQHTTTTCCASGRHRHCTTSTLGRRGGGVQQTPYDGHMCTKTL
jgi:hypothetical protein